MVLVGIDPHTDTDTVVAVDQAGRQLDQATVPARTPGHGQLVSWLGHAGRSGPGPWRTAATSRAGWNATGWPPGSAGRGGPARLLAGARQAVGALGRSDPIDALAVARAARREPNLRPPAMTRRPGRSSCWSTIVNTWSPNAPDRSTGYAGSCTSSTRPGTPHPPAARSGPGRSTAWLAQATPASRSAAAPTRAPRAAHSPTRSASWIVTSASGSPDWPDAAPPARLRAADRGQADRRDRRGGRFRSAACLPARRRGPGQLRPHRPPRLSGAGHRQLQAALHRITLTQLRLPDPGQASSQRRRAQGEGTGEAVRAGKRRIARAVYQRLRTAQLPATTFHTATA